MDTQTIESLNEIKDNTFDFNNKDIHTLAKSMLDNIGHPNSAIRDDLIYPCLGHLFNDGHFSEAELTKYAYILIDDAHLMYDINNTKFNSVLTRSFSLLQLAIILNVHRRDAIINKKTIKDIYKKFMMYFKQETVFEGYNDTVGWIHAIAHSADVIDEFVQIQWFEEPELTEMFDTICDKMKQSNHLFNFNEDERMVTALTHGIKRNMISQTELKAWISRFATNTETLPVPNSIYLKKNIKQLLRSLYFSLIKEENDKVIIKHIENVLINNV